MHVALHRSAGHDLQPLGCYGAFHPSADDDVAGPDRAHETALLADHDAGVGFDVAFDAAVQVQVVAQGDIADKFAAGRDDGGSSTRTLLRTVLAKDCH